jgi:hypothetical protein
MDTTIEADIELAKKFLDQANRGGKVKRICRYCRECIPHGKIAGNYGCIQHLRDVKDLEATCDRCCPLGVQCFPERKMWKAI